MHAAATVAKAEIVVVFLTGRMNRRFSAVFLLGFLSLAAFGCARISRFEATGQYMCAGQSTSLSWKACGKLAVRIDVETQPAGDACSAAGQEVTKYTLVARRFGKEKTRPVEVASIRPGAREPILFSTSDLSNNFVVARGTKDVAWGNRVEVVTIAACENRGIEVRHGGRTVELDSTGQPTDKLSGTPLMGDWEFRSPLSPAESNDHALIPSHLKVIATIRCSVNP